MLQVLMVWLGVVAHAETADADDVVRRAREANQVSSSIQTVEMTIVGKNGRGERHNKLLLKSRRIDGSVSTVLQVLPGSDSGAGVKMLMVDHADKADEQMVHMPSVGTNRIAGGSRRGSFVGSDFTYEDLDIREAAEGEHTLVSETPEVWVIDTVPADSPQYGKVRSQISKADLVARKIEFFDRKSGEAIKRLEVLETTTRDGAVVPVQTKMTHLERNSWTLLKIVEQRINVPESELPESTFTKAYLER